MILDENRCIIKAEVVIDEVLHKVENKFVKCDKSLNSRAWGVTVKKSVCEKCFPKQSMFSYQITIFDQGA